MWSILENYDSQPLFGTAKFVIHTFCTEFVGLCTSFHMHLASQGTVSSTMIRVFGSRWLVYNEDCGLRYVWTMSVNCSFLSRSAWSVQSLVCCRLPNFFMLLVGIVVVPSLTNGIKVMPVFLMRCFFFCFSSNMPIA